jgi:hypothetical protein
MKHFDISQWLDHARGFVTAAARETMDAHLTTGCARCRTARHFVQQVLALAPTAAGDEPPADAVRWAKAIAVVRRPRRTSPSRLLARLVYNSLLDPSPAGLRAEDQLSRHALYEAGHFALDVRVEHERTSPLLTLVGQVTNRETPDQFVADAPVLLMARRDVVAHTVSNRYGEFQLDCAPAHHLRLCVVLDSDGTRLEASLRRLGAEF